MTQMPIDCKSGRQYVCHIPDVTVADGRMRTQQFRELNTSRKIKESRSVLLERHMDEIASEGPIGDIDAALARLDSAAERVRVAKVEADSTGHDADSLALFCDSIDGYSSFEDLPESDLSDLLVKCLRVFKGLNPDPPVPTA